MINRWHAAGIFFHHWLLKEDQHSIHSPALFKLYQEVFYPTGNTGILQEAESIRSKLKSDERPVPSSAFGSRPSTPAKKRTIASVVKTEAASASAAAMLGRLANFQNAKHILEIGTSIGLTTLYLSTKPDTKVVTIEGNPVIADVARQVFAETGRGNIHLKDGNADELVPRVLNEGFLPDMVILDANHRYEPTFRYLHHILNSTTRNITLVMDDIHYSPEMTHAWHTARDLFPQSLAINLGRRGILLTVDTKDRINAYW